MLRSYIWILTTSLALSTGGPALAQYTVDKTDSGNKSPFGSTATAERPRLKLRDIGRPYSIRVTTGAHNSTAWVGSLTKKDQNLRHWTWIPVTSVDQTVVGMGGKNRNLPKRPEHVYKKPIHVPTQIAQGADNRPGLEPIEPTAPSAPHYIKPRHIPLPTVDHGQILMPPPRHTTTQDLSGRVKLPKPAPPVQAAKALPPAKTYGYSYSDISGHLRPGGTNLSEDKSVHGKLLAH
jgi:hypothetical protein